MPVDLTCYVYEGWSPRIRAASQRRDWMDDGPESFAYRCLPLNIANAHGWELLCPCGFEAEWNGGPTSEDVTIYLDQPGPSIDAPVGLFGLGTITFHVPGLFRTTPGWDLWVGGSPNAAKDGIAPLGGIIETDWSPYTFTMNWRFTRPHHRVRFEQDEPICFFFPLERGVIEEVEPRITPIEADPELKAHFEAWSRSRDAFQKAVIAEPPTRPADKWQKLYYRGVGPDEAPGAPDHRSKVRLKGFAGAKPTPAACPVASLPQRQSPSPVQGGADKALARRDWLLRTQQTLRGLSPAADQVRRLTEISPEAFLEHFYAANKPVVLGGLVADWPAHRLWTPEYLKSKIGNAEVEVQDRRQSQPDFERQKEAHSTSMPFDVFVDRLVDIEGNDVYLTAFNSRSNAIALAPLQTDLRTVDAILTSSAGNQGMPWIGGRGTFTPLHHDLTNNLLVQITGRKRVILVSPLETPQLYNDQHVFSLVQDITASDIDRGRYPLIGGVRFQELILDPGDALFIPVGWWHQVRSLDFSVSISYTNFIWPNDFSSNF